jgi:hypothetical protein
MKSLLALLTINLACIVSIPANADMTTSAAQLDSSPPAAVVALRTDEINPITVPAPPAPGGAPKETGKPLIPDAKPVIGNPEASRQIDKDTAVPEVTHIN